MKSCSCNKIQLRVVPISLPSFCYDGDGNVFFDTLQSFELSHRNTDKSLGVDVSIPVEATLGFGLPSTARNNAIFAHYRTTFGYSRIPVIAWSDMFSLQENLLSVVRYEDAQYNDVADGDGFAFYECQLFLSDTHWAVCASDVRVCDIFRGITFEYTKQNITDTFILPSWFPPAPPLQFPFFDYGNIHDITIPTYRIEDLRPLVNDLFLLQKGFCLCGIVFRCPYLETLRGRAEWSYLIKSDYYTADGNGLDYEAIATSDVQFDVYNLLTTKRAVLFNTIIKDNHGAFATANIYDDFYLNTVFKNTLPFKTCFNTCVEFTIMGLLNGASGYFELTRMDLIDGLPVAQYTTFGTFEFSLSDTLPHTFSFCASDDIWHINTGAATGEVAFSYIHAVLHCDSTSPPIRHLSSSIKVIPCTKGIVRNSVIDIADLLRCDVTLLDFLKGKQHELNGRLLYNAVTRELTLYTPYDEEHEGSAIEGYYTTSQVADISNIVQCGSLVEEYPTAGAREMILGYKPSDEAYLKSLLDSGQYSELALPHNRKIDFGEGTNEIATSFNNLFAAAIEKHLDYADPIVTPTLRDGIFTPALWDNTNNEISYNISDVFNFVAYGLTRQYVSGNSSVMGFRGVRFELETMQYFPYFTQNPLMQLDSTYNNRYMLYGSPDRNTDFYTLHYSRAIQEAKQLPKISLLLKLSALQYFSFSFRISYIVQYVSYFGDSLFYLQADEVNDFKPCNEGLTAVTFKRLDKKNNTC